jgi:hypothetical protein
VAVLEVDDAQAPVRQTDVLSSMGPESGVIWSPMRDQRVHNGESPLKIWYRLPAELDRTANSAHGLVSTSAGAAALNS